MTIDFWGLGLQAVNVLILVWLLAHFFWRPVAGAIARRQAAAQAMLDTADAKQSEAAAALAEVTKARAGIAAERDAVLATAKTEAEAASQAAAAEARANADTMAAAAHTAIARDADAAHAENAKLASALSVEIAGTLLARLNTPAVQAGFLALLTEAIGAMSESDRAALVAAGDLRIVSATKPDDAEKSKIEAAVVTALGGKPAVVFETDPELIAGLELRSAHFVLHNSWQADLTRIRQELNHPA